MWTTKRFSKNRSNYYVLVSGALIIAVMIGYFIFSFKIWKRSLDARMESNSYRWVIGKNKFNNLSEEEFKKRMLLPSMNMNLKCYRRSDSTIYNSNSNTPSYFDWRNKDAVGPVQNQKMCLGCWAFSIVGVMESMVVIRSLKNGTPRNVPELSVQELLDCSQSNHGCDGGNTDSALDYMYKYKLKIVPEHDYPLMLINQQCGIHGETTGVGILKYYAKCNVSKDEVMFRIANHGPLVALVNALPWKNYISGIIDEHCDNSNTNHVVQIVGYDTRYSIPYYIVKNSWGENFGDDGYLYIAMGQNVCGIESRVYYLEINGNV